MINRAQLDPYWQLILLIYASLLILRKRVMVASSFLMFTSEFNTFVVVLNTWLQKSDVHKTWLFSLSSQLVFVLNGCSLALSASHV